MNVSTLINSLSITNSGCNMKHILQPSKGYGGYRGVSTTKTKAAQCQQIHLHFFYACVEHLHLVPLLFNCLAVWRFSLSAIQLFSFLAHYVSGFYGAVWPDNLTICMTINMLTDFCIDLQL